MDLSLAESVWRKKAKSDCRLKLMIDLLDMGLGFNELEHFNEALHQKIRSESVRRRLQDGKKSENKVVREAMLFKIRDEQCTNKEADVELQKERRNIKNKYGENTRRCRGILRVLNEMAQSVRHEKNETYKRKLKTLKERNMGDMDAKLNRVPPEIKDYEDAKIFSRERFDGIQEANIEIVKVGDVEINEDEERIIKKHPKFALLEDLKIEDLELDFEIGFGKYRYQRLGEIRDKKEIEKTGIGDKEEEIQSPEERQKEEIQDAMTRQIFDPIDKIYDGRKLRVTDLEINTRVTLPKGLPEDQEAHIEIRRSKYLEVCRKYITNNCNQKGEQRSNLSKEELRGLISLKKRIKEGNLIIMNTDKSNKFGLTDIDTYRAMGRVHTSKDKKITRRELIEREKTLNSHCAMWNKMYNLGEDHDHSDRIHDSLVQHDQSLAVMSLLLKDHKEGNKTRQVVSGNSSNTIGLSIIA